MQPSPFEPFSTPSWLKPKQRDRVLRIPARLMWALLLSLIFHAIIFWGFLLDLLTPTQEPSQAPLNIVLDLGLPVPPTPKVTPPPALPLPVPESVPQPKPKRPPKVEPTLPKKIIQSQRPDNVLKVPEPKTQPRPEQPQPMPAPPVEDFSSFIKRKQTDRNADEMAAKQINDAAAAAERGPSEDERRTKNIMNNLKFGSNGLFQIRRMDPYNATFSFKGWVNDYTSANTQYYEVEARNGEDIRLVMIRRMIVIVREHYDGDFDWISNRLGRTVTLSARPADNAALEEFLMKEFFGNNYKNLDVYGR